MRRQHPPVEVVRRMCGVTDGLPQERMAAAAIPAMRWFGAGLGREPHLLGAGIMV
jgi:hypothetical protein